MANLSVLFTHKSILCFEPALQRFYTLNGLSINILHDENSTKDFGFNHY